MAEDIYLKLREFLDKLPAGYPATDSGVEMKILKKIFTPEEAAIAVQLRWDPEPVAAIAPRLKMDEAQAAEKLEAMAKKGLIYRVRTEDQQLLYKALQFVVGIYEFYMNSLDLELLKLFREYWPILSQSWESFKTSQLRVVPIETSLSTNSSVTTYDQIRELVKGKKPIAVAPCICKKSEMMLGNTSCDRPLERCVLFEFAAQYYIDNKLGREIDEEELMSIFKMGEEKALVLQFTNSKKIVNFCMCCGCCCAILRSFKQFPEPADHVQSTFYAEIAPDLCISCGACEERCQMEAISAGEKSNEVNRDRCIGCGLCVTACPVDAISLKVKSDPRQLPETIDDIYIKMAEERGVPIV